MASDGGKSVDGPGSDGGAGGSRGAAGVGGEFHPSEVTGNREFTVNQTELARIHGVSDVTLWEWQKQGMPVAVRGEKGKENRYVPAATIAWRVEREVRKVQAESPKDRLARLQGDKLVLDLAQQQGTLVPVAEIEPTWQQRVLTAVALMASRHSRLAGILETTIGVEAKRQVLKKEDAAFLAKLGVDGARMQAELEALLAKVSESEAAAFLARIAGHGDTSGPAGLHRSSVGGVPPEGEAPAQ